MSTFPFPDLAFLSWGWPNAAQGPEPADTLEQELRKTLPNFPLIPHPFACWAMGHVLVNVVNLTQTRVIGGKRTLI